MNSFRLPYHLIVEQGLHRIYDSVEDAFRFTVLPDSGAHDGIWQPRFWGNMRLSEIEIRE